MPHIFLKKNVIGEKLCSNLPSKSKKLLNFRTITIKFLIKTNFCVKKMHIMFKFTLKKYKVIKNTLKNITKSWLFLLKIRLSVYWQNFDTQKKATINFFHISTTPKRLRFARESCAEFAYA